MTFGSTFGRTFSPTFQSKSQAPAAAGGGWWDLNGTITSCVAAYQPKGAASYAASKVNLANSGTYDAGNGTNYPTWDDTNGWKFLASSSQYLTTGITPTSSWSAILRISDMTTKLDMWAFGNYASSGWGIQPQNGYQTIYYNGSARSIPRNVTSGVFALAGAQGYYNGSADGTATTGNAAPNAAIFIGDVSGEYRRYLTGYVQAFAIYNATLTSTQIGNLTTAMNAL